MDQRFVTTGQLAKAWGYSRETIRSMCEDGLLEGAHQLAGKKGHWRIPAKHLGQEKTGDGDGENRG